MITILFACAVLVTGTTFVHYEFLRGLNVLLPKVNIPSRRKLLVVVITTFVAHAIEIAMYGLGMYLLVTYMDVGILAGQHLTAVDTFLYFSTETYTSLGFGDIRPVGPIRLLVGVEALNGLLLIGWSASFTYLAMERFWAIDGSRR
jgi:voltage-gated potassium channel Kch